MTNREFIEDNNTPQKRIKVLRALELSEADPKDKEMSIWDKRRWLILEDYWMGNVSKEYAEEVLSKITEEEGGK